MKLQFAYRKYILILLILVGIFQSCKKDKNESIKMHYEYFGLLQGRFVTYNVTEIYHDIDAAVQHDTINYQLKTWIGQEYIDNDGRTAREFVRFKRDSTNGIWLQSDLWTAIIENYKAELVEENQRLIKLVYAPILNKKWNMNTFNQNDELECEYTSVHQPYFLNSVQYDSTLTVDQESYYTLVDCKRKFEVYSKNVGLIYKYYKDLRINNFDTLAVEKGTEIYYKCIGYGFQ